MFPFSLIFSPLGARWWQICSIGTDYTVNYNQAWVSTCPKLTGFIELEYRTFISEYRILIIFSTNMYSVFKCNKFDRVNLWHPLKTSTAKKKFWLCRLQKTSTAKSFFWLCRLRKTSTAKSFFWLWKSENLILAVENVRTLNYYIFNLSARALFLS